MRISHTAYTEQELAHVGVKVLEKAMRIGSVAGVRGALGCEKRQSQIREHAGSHGRAVQSEAKRWLLAGEAYEAVHGQRSLLKTDDPYVRNVLLPAVDRMRENASRAARRRSGITESAHQQFGVGDFGERAADDLVVAVR